MGEVIFDPDRERLSRKGRPIRLTSVEAALLCALSERPGAILSREELIDRIFSEEYQSYREMKDLFFLGLSYAGEEDSTARNYCGQAFEIIDNYLDREPDNKEMLQFLQAHHRELINLFGRDPDVINRLIRLDPDREEDYRRYLEK